MREIPLTRGYVALVDDEDYELVMAAGSWQVRPGRRTNYAMRGTRRPDGRRTTQSMHLFLTGWHQVDHRNGNGLDNTRANLREATDGQNAANRPAQANGTSGFKGVTHKKRGRWQAQLMTGGKNRHLGYFGTPEDAARAYDAAAAELFGDFARLNFPEEIL